MLGIFGGLHFYALLTNLPSPMMFEIGFMGKKKYIMSNLIINNFCILSQFVMMINYDMSEGFITFRKEAIIDELQMALPTMLIIISIRYVDFLMGNIKDKLLTTLNENILEKTKERERFFASVSHELRNPLNSLLISIELVATEEDPLKKKEMLTNATSCGEMLLHLIGNVLDVSKISEGKVEIILKDCDLKETIGKVISINKANAHKKGINLQLICDANLPPCLKIDPVKFNQVMMNIIANAVKFTERGGVFVKISWIPLATNEVEDYCTIQRSIENSFQTNSRTSFLETSDEFIKGHNQFEKANLIIKQYKNRFTPSVNRKVNPSNLAIGSDLSSNLSDTSSSYIEDLIEEEDPFMGLVKVEVIDSGIGIKKKKYQKIIQAIRSRRSFNFSVFILINLGDLEELDLGFGLQEALYSLWEEIQGLIPNRILELIS
eukprot:TRINITY_DN592_c0_g1_i1.p1 TRINITY_DN592_c0_g1~~TRINITY_DN592_c0_g1_i1.p1  ORF type:complete len:436 (+),score=94.54 TRINITY_DN592_c0_g1_i1:297-1604(+)